MANPVAPDVIVPGGGLEVAPPQPHIVVAPGKCQFGLEWSATPLIERTWISKTTILCTFRLPDVSKPLGLATCACLLARLEGDDHSVRPYTPVSTNRMNGHFQLLVKVYDKGVMSTALSAMDVGACVMFKHIPQNVKRQYPFGAERLGLIAGGTGITPMLQALQAVLGTDEDTTKVSLVYGSRTSDDILGYDILQNWVDVFQGRFEVTYVLSHEPPTSSWSGPRGFIDRTIIDAHMPPPNGSDSLIFVCGPPPLYSALCGPRDEANLTGTLAEAGYTADQVYKF